MHISSVVFGSLVRFKASLFTLLMTTTLILSSCSGGGDESGDSVVTPVLRFSSPSSITVIENELTDITLNAIERDGNSVSYSIAEGDETSFDINNSSGIVTFKTAPDYESKSMYTFVATASNGSVSITQNVTVHIEDYNNPFQVARLQDSNSTSGAFGTAISTDGNYTVVGSYGYAYLYKMNVDNSMELVTKFQADDTNSTNYFGVAAAIYGKYIVVGDYVEDSNGVDAGCAYLFKIAADETVSQIAKLQADDAEAGDNFGISLSIDGNYIAVGARSKDKDTIAVNAGSAYLFTIAADETVLQTAKIEADDAEADDYFGHSISIDGSYIVVGARFEDSTATDAGSAYLYKITADDSVSQVAKIQANDAEESDGFGIVSIDDNYIVVGATSEDTVATDAGSAYLYKIAVDDTVSQIAKIQADDAMAYDWFGNSISMDGDNIVIGASLANDIGTVYLFKKDQNDQVVQVKAIHSKVLRGDDTYYGSSVSISGTTIAIGAPNEDTPDYDAGRAYIFNTEPLDKIYVYSNMVDVVDMDEGTLKDVYSIEAGSPNGAITYNVSGTDGDNFVLAEEKISVSPVLDYEVSQDSNTDNSYDISIDLQDSAGNQLSYPLMIAVNDRHYIDLAKIQASDAASDDGYAEAVAIDGNYTVVGAPDEDTTASDAGSVYVYKKASNGDVVQIAKLQADDAEASDHFGSAVAIDGKYILVGAPDEDTTASGAGSVYIFKIANDETISQIAKVQATNAASNSYFGTSVSIDGVYIAVGGFNGNSVNILKIEPDDTVTQLAEITGTDTVSGDFFGGSVSLSGNYVVVGAEREDTTAGNAGSAYVFEIASNDTVAQITKIQASDAAGENYFGNSVSISEQYIVVGATGRNSVDSSGSAYLFKVAADDTVSQLAKLKADDASNYDRFGGSVAVSGKYIVAGAENENTTAYGAGSAYVFEIAGDETVSQVDKIQAFDVEAYDSFGYAVAISGDNIVIGSQNEDTTGVSYDDRTSATYNAGSAYIYTKDLNQ